MDNVAFELVLNGLLLSINHAMLPNHWLPVITIGKAEKWSKRTTVSIAAITAFTHTMSTLILGGIVGWFGHEFDHALEHVIHLSSATIVSAVMIVWGAVYLFKDARGGEHTHIDASSINKKSYGSIVLTLCIAMLFSPCLEIQPYFFHLGSHGLPALLALGTGYLVISVAGISLMTLLSDSLLRLRSFHWLEHHEYKVTGYVLILLGILIWLVH